MVYLFAYYLLASIFFLEGDKMPRKRYTKYKKSNTETKQTSNEVLEDTLATFAKVQQRHAKTKIETSNSTPTSKKIVILPVAIVVIIILFASGIFFNPPSSNSSPRTGTGEQYGDTIQIKMSDITNTAKFFSYNDNGILIRYFVVKGTDNLVHVAIDACDVCYTEKRGYKQENNYMKCENCGQKFVIENLGTDNLEGGCWPSYLPVKIEVEAISIKISDLRLKSFMFA
jgi:uncharacterized membrane protein